MVQRCRWIRCHFFYKSYQGVEDSVGKECPFIFTFERAESAFTVEEFRADVRYPWPSVYNSEVPRYRYVPSDWHSYNRVLKSSEIPSPCSLLKWSPASAGRNIWSEASSEGRLLEFLDRLVWTSSDVSLIRSTYSSLAGSLSGRCKSCSIGFSFLDPTLTAVTDFEMQHWTPHCEGAIWQRCRGQGTNFHARPGNLVRFSTFITLLLLNIANILTAQAYEVTFWNL
jgi:hypothetical protein